MHWSYRVSKQTLKNGDFIFAIREVYPNKKGEMTSWTQDEIAPVGDSLDALRWVLNEMLKACDKEIIDIGEADV